MGCKLLRLEIVDPAIKVFPVKVDAPPVLLPALGVEDAGDRLDVRLDYLAELRHAHAAVFGGVPLFHESWGHGVSQ